MATLLLLIFITGAMSSSAVLGPGRLWTATTTTKLGEVWTNLYVYDPVVVSDREATTLKVANYCCGECLAKFPGTTKFHFFFHACWCLKDLPGKTAETQAIEQVGICGNNHFPAVTVGEDIAWGGESRDSMIKFGEVTGVESIAQCCEECAKVNPATQIFLYLDTDPDRFPMFHIFQDRKCFCYGTKPETQPFTYPSIDYAEVCDAPYIDGTQAGQNCTDLEFACANGRECIPARYKCDGRAHCITDRSDEFPSLCGGCSPEEFACADGRQCIKAAEKCDVGPDCKDGSDEFPSLCGCTDEEFACADDSKCIDAHGKCDGYASCKDGSDELEEHCGNCTEFACADGRQCLPTELVCDDWVQCTDGSDEEPGICG